MDNDMRRYVAHLHLILYEKNQPNMEIAILNEDSSSRWSNEVASVSGSCQGGISGGPEHPLNDVGWW